MKHSKTYDRIFVAISLSALVAASLRADDLYIWARETASGVTFFLEGSVDTSEFPAPVSDKGGKGSGRVAPNTGGILFGSSYGLYDDVLPGSGRSFGTGTSQSASDSSGDNFWLSSVPSTDLGLPSSYTSGSPLSGSLEFSGETFASLGLDTTPFSFHTTVGSNTIYMFQSPEEVAARAAEIARLQRKIRKLNRKSKRLRKTGEATKAKKLKRKVKKLKRQLAAL